MQSVTGRVRSFKQPYGGFLRPSEFEVTKIDDGLFLEEEENIHASVVGMAVDYLSRYMLGDEIEDAFAISILGYKNRIRNLGKHTEREDKKKQIDIGSLLERITGINDASIVAACKAVTYDVRFRSEAAAPNAKGAFETNPDEKTINNIRVMVNRCVKFWKIHGPIVSAGFTFEPFGYTDIVSTGDGDYLTEDTLWDLKVSKSKPTSKNTLQILMYWLMGLHSEKPEFRYITKIGIYNPRLNMSFVMPINAISEETIRIVERDVIGYKSSYIKTRKTRIKKHLSSHEKKGAEWFARFVLFTCIFLIALILVMYLKPSSTIKHTNSEIVISNSVSDNNGYTESYQATPLKTNINTIEPSYTIAPSISEGTRYIRIRNGKNINVRRTPDTSAVRIGMAVAGKQYQLLGIADNGWYEIELEDGKTGYVSNKLASIESKPEY